ncbi:MAG: DNA recombination protein RmuC [Candidatus Parcubacteria bacterium]|nr:DNA recombination protein RmuC [Candidatus Parcubacteria bacterium]
MNTLSIVIIVILAVIIGGLVAILLLRGQKKTAGSDQGMLMLQHRLDSLMQVVDKKLGESQNATLRQFSESQKFMQDINSEMKRHLSEVTKAVTETNEGSKQVLGITEELHNLQKILTNQKHRGSLGEASLELILGNVLPPDAYQLQYPFADNDKVDAVIKTKDGMIPIDAKFSLDNYNRIINETNPERKAELEKDFIADLKKRIDETAKYIRPSEGTLPFAMMYIPAEGIYYDLLVNEVGAIKSNTRSLIDYAYKDKHVIIVSPTTFSAYLSSVLYGFRAFKIEESARDISKRVEELGKHLKAYDEYYKKLGNSLGTVVGHYNSGAKELNKIDKDVVKITGNGTGIEMLSLDKPSNET